MPAGHGTLHLQRAGFLAIAAVGGLARLACASLCDMLNLTLETCPPGTWKNEWHGAPCEWYNCLECPQGRYTDRPNRSACRGCPPGQVSEGATGCIECPSGRFAEPGGAACRRCQRGDYAQRGSGICRTCPAGTRTNNAQSGCAECPAGRYSEYASSNCTRCSRGEYSRPGAAHCEPCAAGSVVDPGGNGCTACPAGTFSNFGDMNCTACAPGTISAGGSPACELCPPGTSPDLERGECNECPPGMHSQEGWPVCELCPNGTYTALGVECEQCPAGETPVVNQSGCEKCPDGMHSEPGWMECRACPNGTVSYLGMAQCERCLPGYEPDPRRASCVPCGAGTYSGHEMDSCRPCPAGVYSVAGSGECRACAVGEVPNALRTGCAPCEPGWVPDESKDGCGLCPLGTHAAQGDEHCELDVELFVALEACVVHMFVAVLILASHMRSTLKIEDIDRFGAKVVVTTKGNHGVGKHKLWAKCRGTVRARLVENTGNRCLDDIKGFRLRVLDPRRLELAPLDGSPIHGDVGTSKGALRLDFRSEFFCYGEWFPVVLVSVVLFPVPFLIPFFNGRLYTLSWLFAIAIALSFLLALAAARLWRWLRYRSPNMLERRVEQFRRQLLAGNPTPQSCEHSHERAVSVKQLVELHDFFQDFIRSRNAYYLDPNVTKPLTKPYRLSYAELAGPQPLMYFVSHFWGTPFGHFVETVRKHATTLGLQAWATTSYWICFLSNNQWALSQELGSSWKESSFFKALRSGCCRGTCMVLDSDARPLSRSWCLFEVLQSYQLLHQSRSQFEGLIFCTERGVIGADNDRCYDVTIALASRLTNLHAQDATASNPADQAMIEKCVEEELGGMDALNVFIRRTMLGDLNRATEHFRHDIDMVKGALQAEAGDGSP